MDWYYANDGMSIGPNSLDAMKHHIKNGRINAETPVWNSSMGEWRPLGTLPDFTGLISTGASSMPPPPPGRSLPVTPPPLESSATPVTPSRAAIPSAVTSISGLGIVIGSMAFWFLCVAFVIVGCYITAVAPDFIPSVSFGIPNGQFVIGAVIGLALAWWAAPAVKSKRLGDTIKIPSVFLAGTVAIVFSIVQAEEQGTQMGVIAFAAALAAVITIGLPWLAIRFSKVG